MWRHLARCEGPVSAPRQSRSAPPPARFVQCVDTMKYRVALTFVASAAVLACAPRFSTMPAAYLRGGAVAETQDVRVVAAPMGDRAAVCDCPALLVLRV